jgi:hypothetical protein
MSNQTSLAQNADVKGWGKTAWGMSEGEIIKLYPEARRFNNNTLRLLNIPIGNHKYDVLFTTDRNKKLTKVMVAIPRSYQSLESQFEELKKELTLKYGVPLDKNSSSIQQIMNTMVSTWSFPSTTIELNYTFCVDPSHKMPEYHQLMINYRPNISNDNL